MYPFAVHFTIHVKIHLNGRETAMRDFILEKAVPYSIGVLVISFITLPPDSVRQALIGIFQQVTRYVN